MGAKVQAGASGDGGRTGIGAGIPLGREGKEGGESPKGGPVCKRVWAANLLSYGGNPGAGEFYQGGVSSGRWVINQGGGCVKKREEHRGVGAH